MSVINAVDRTSVIRVYSGKPGCMCGCNGTYRYSSTIDRAIESKKRGYPITDDEINDRQVTRVLAVINEHLETAEFSPGEFVTVQVNGRDYFAFFD